MIPTKTYPLSAITDAFNRVCAENADFVAEANRDEARIAKLEAQLADANEMLEKCNSKFIVALEAENARLKAALDKYSEDETLGELRGELLLRCCIEICQEESTDNGTSQKIEARIRALKEKK